MDNSLRVLCCAVLASLCAGEFEIDGTFHLAKREGVEVGYTREIYLAPGMTRTMKTVQLNPTIFEIPDFLSPEECEFIIKIAKNIGLQESELHSEPPEESHTEKQTKDIFKRWDKNKNGVLEPIEFTTLDGKSSMFHTEEEALDMFATLDADANNDNVMDFEEFEYVKPGRIRSYFNLLRQKNPFAHGRNSSHAWIWHYGSYNELLEGFHEKLARLTMLPREIIQMSEPLQVVNYGVTGHYHCHHDSDENDAKIPCCNYEIQNLGKCRLCRFITVLYFLNNVREGGETAFPVAGNETFNRKNWEIEMKDKCNLVKSCHNSNLIIKPKKGTALMWYNHHIDERNGWVGNLDHRTFHGGCGVIKGQKWIANNWINIIGRPGSSDSRMGWLRNRIDGGRDEL